MRDETRLGYATVLRTAPLNYKNEPNQALEPTPVLASEQASTGVAHLRRWAEKYN